MHKQVNRSSSMSGVDKRFGALHDVNLFEDVASRARVDDRLHGSAA